MSETVTNELICFKCLSRGMFSLQINLQYLQQAMKWVLHTCTKSTTFYWLRTKLLHLEHAKKRGERNTTNQWTVQTTKLASKREILFSFRKLNVQVYTYTRIRQCSPTYQRKALIFSVLHKVYTALSCETLIHAFNSLMRDNGKLWKLLTEAM